MLLYVCDENEREVHGRRGATIDDRRVARFRAKLLCCEFSPVPFSSSDIDDVNVFLFVLFFSFSASCSHSSQTSLFSDQNVRTPTKSHTWSDKVHPSCNTPTLTVCLPHKSTYSRCRNTGIILWLHDQHDGPVQAVVTADHFQSSCEQSGTLLFDTLIEK